MITILKKHKDSMFWFGLLAVVLAGNPPWLDFAFLSVGILMLIGSFAGSVLKYKDHNL